MGGKDDVKKTAKKVRKGPDVRTQVHKQLKAAIDRAEKKTAVVDAKVASHIKSAVMSALYKSLNQQAPSTTTPPTLAATAASQQQPARAQGRAPIDAANLKSFEAEIAAAVSANDRNLEKIASQVEVANGHEVQPVIPSTSSYAEQEVRKALQRAGVPIEPVAAKAAAKKVIEDPKLVKVAKKAAKKVAKDTKLEKSATKKKKEEQKRTKSEEKKRTKKDKKRTKKEKKRTKKAASAKVAKDLKHVKAVKKAAKKIAIVPKKVAMKNKAAPAVKKVVSSLAVKKTLTTRKAPKVQPKESIAQM